MLNTYILKVIGNKNKGKISFREELVQTATYEYLFATDFDGDDKIKQTVLPNLPNQNKKRLNLLLLQGRFGSFGRQKFQTR